LPGTGNACSAIPVRAARLPRRVCESAHGSHNLPSCRSGPVATNEGAVIRFRMPEKQTEERWYAMSQSFRPVKEIWNSHSSCFVESEELVALLQRNHFL